MRFTVGSLACNAACLGFATGLAKAPSQGVSSRMSLKTSPVSMREGPLRDVERAGEEPGLRQRLRAKAWTTGRRVLSLRGQQGKDPGEEGFQGGQPAEKSQVWRSWLVSRWTFWLSAGDVCVYRWMSFAPYIKFDPTSPRGQHVSIPVFIERSRINAESPRHAHPPPPSAVAGRLGRSNLHFWLEIRFLRQSACPLNSSRKIPLATSCGGHRSKVSM